MGSLYCINGITETGLVLNESRDFEFYHGMDGSQLTTNIIGLSFFLTRRITRDTMQFTHRIHDDRTHVGPASRVTLGLSYFRNNPNRESPGINGVRRVITGLGLVFSGMGWGCDQYLNVLKLGFPLTSDINGRGSDHASGGLTAWCERVRFSTDTAGAYYIGARTARMSMSNQNVLAKRPTGLQSHRFGWRGERHMTRLLESRLSDVAIFNVSGVPRRPIRWGGSSVMDPMQYRCGLNAVEAALRTLYYMAHAMAAPELFPTGDLSAVLVWQLVLWRIIVRTEPGLPRTRYHVKIRKNRSTKLTERAIIYDPRQE
ncbi:hypothetical protein BDR06DRAFT_997393 [Suillus hirtellus]|nr:hypothetical protein BDR06DRAFT_997393 [Suillus hirtellus]